MNQNKKPFHETVAENLIKQLEQGTAPWQRPWEPGDAGSFVPFNPVTGNRYKGINALQLMSQERDDQRWLTYKQSGALGGQVRRGEKGTSIQYWKFTEEHIKKDEQGQPVLDEEGKPIKVTVKLERPRVFYATVFNAEQIDGLPPLVKKQQTWDAIERAENILSASGAVINHNAGDRAFYRPSSDSIHLPEKGQFQSADKFYATALHELGHWSGARSRLDRDLSHPFGSEGYAKEELRAEIASMILGDELGIGHDPGQHAAYVGAWIKVLKDDPLEIFRAAADAERIQNYVLGLEQKQVQDLLDNPNTLAGDNAVVREFRKTNDDLTANQKISKIKQQPLQTNYEQASDKDVALGREDKTYIQVPYQEKNQVRALGAKWDRGEQSWYVPSDVDLGLFVKWPQSTAMAKTEHPYLAVPYTERNIAKSAGARWDKKAKSWYAGENADMHILKQWLLDNVKDQQVPAMTAREEFAEVLSSLGCVVSGEHPIMDGQTHRIATAGDKSGERAGFYVAYLDEHPAGFIQNNRTGDTMKWKFKGYSLSEAEKAQLKANNAAKLQEREAVRKVKQDTIAHSVRELLKVAPPAPAEHPYLQLKQARPGYLRVVPEDMSALPSDSNIIIGKNRKESQALRESNPDKLIFTAGDLLLSAIDINGEIRSVQSIQGNGLKRFAAGGAKQDAFHVVGGQGLDDLGRSPAIVIGEGYATVDTLSQELGFPTVAAFDSGNLPSVARLLRERFPDKPFIIAGDNDLHQELTDGRNPGKEKALEAAKSVNGIAIFPIFAPGEQTYPAILDPVTSTKARSGDLSNDQKAAIAQMKNFTDFNDLATKSAYGMGGVERQLINIVNRIIVRSHEQNEIKQQQAYDEKIELQQVQPKAMKI